MQKIKLYLKPHQAAYLKSICGAPPALGAKYNLAPLLFSLLRWEEYQTTEKGLTAIVPDWVMESSGGKNNLSERGHKVMGDYIDSLMDVDFWDYIKPYYLNHRLELKDGIYLFIDKHNLPNTDNKVYNMLIKRYYRIRKTQQKQKNPAEFFNDISIFK